MNAKTAHTYRDTATRVYRSCVGHAFMLLGVGLLGVLGTGEMFAQSTASQAKSNAFVLPKRLPVAQTPQRLAPKQVATKVADPGIDTVAPSHGSIEFAISPNASSDSRTSLPTRLPKSPVPSPLPHRLAPSPSQPVIRSTVPSRPHDVVTPRPLPAKLASSRTPVPSFEGSQDSVAPSILFQETKASEATPERIPEPVKEPTQTSPTFEPWEPPSLLRSKNPATRGFPAFDAGLIEQNHSYNERPPLYQISHRLGKVIHASGDLIQDKQMGAPGTHQGIQEGFNQLATHQETVPNAGLVDRSLCPSIPWNHADDFSPTPLPVDELFHDSVAEQSVYDDKHPVPTQRPWIEWGRKFYGSGITPPSETWMGETNLVQQQLYLYGDYRTGIATGRNDFGRIDNWASRLNLDLDYRVTATERFHAFFGPLNRATQFTRMEYVNDEFEYQSFYNLNPVTAFFEGDLGAIFGGATGTSSPMELPVTAGLVPLVFQNGIWIEDAVSGVAFAIPARHSRALNWANFDATFFAVFDQINSPAFGADNHAAQAFGTGWFIDAYDGYIETGYAYLNDRADLGRSYHNMTASFTRRYFDKISNSVRVIVNAGQDLEKDQRTADGTLLLIENSLVSHEPLTVIPYFNFFAGWDRPQSVARAGVSGGVLRNTGMNFEIDGLNGYPTLDATGADTAGGAVGVDLIGDDFDRQLILEASYVTPHGDRSFINGDQYALGTRYQVAISHRSIIRFDTMYGWERGDEDIYGSRIEYRWKF